MQYLKQKKKELSFIFICFLVMGLACLLLYQPLMDILKDPQVLRTQLQSYGIGGQLLLIGIMTLQVVFVFLPGEIIEIMAGFIYGPIVGMIICMIGSAVGSSIIYLFVKKCGIRFIDKLIGLDKVNEVEFLKNKEDLNRSVLLPLISSMVNHPGFKYKKNELIDVGIVEFMDSVQRLQLYENVTALMSGVYSGMLDTSKINLSKELNWLRDLSESS